MPLPLKYLLGLLIFLAAGMLIYFGAPGNDVSIGYGPREIGADQRCPVCGMYPARFPRWHAQIVFKDGNMSAFDSAADLFRFLQDIGRYDKHHYAADVAGIFVTDYDTGGWINGRTAYFVVGSRVLGTMGGDLPAFGNQAAASVFVGRHGGRMLSFGDVTPRIVESLRGESCHFPVAR